MLNAMLMEIELRADDWKHLEFKTVYFGGGTPSVLDSEEIALLLSGLKKHFRLNLEEATLEANPDDFTDVDRAIEWRNMGINRLSIGVQSFLQKDLEWMNRVHNAEQSYAAIENARRAGFENFTIDLIYGLPEANEQEWRKNLEIFLSLEIPHLSAYALTVEPTTPLERMIQKGQKNAPSDLAFQMQFGHLRDQLEQAGYRHYEISNFAIAGYESKHNSAYWKRSPYIGIGPSAHSFMEPIRSWNVRSNVRYMEALEKGKPYSEEEHLSGQEIWNEEILTGLRTADGVNLEELRNKLPQVKVVGIEATLDLFESRAWLTRASNGLLRLNREGMPFADYIASELFAEKPD